MKVKIDGAVTDSREKLHLQLAEGLGFPQWYGKNLDALYDCLTDIREETEIEIVNRSELKKFLGKYEKSFESVLIDAQDENENIKFTVSD